MSKPDDIPSLARERFDYDPEIGVFTWRARAVDEFPSARIAKNWNTRFAGKQAFTSRSPDGYAQVELLIDARRIRIFGHTAAFAFVTGRLPSFELDHHNRVRDDNRFVNLREATRAQNNRNTIKSGRYLTGARKRGSRWEARIRAQGRAVHLGIFDSEAGAHAAYLDAARRFHGDFAPTRMEA